MMKPKGSNELIELIQKNYLKTKDIKRFTNIAEVIENNRKIVFYLVLLFFFILNTFYTKGFSLDLNM